ncbi:MAG: hypothetical protein GX573_21920 [Chloroflexi bacterium]|nr:hypothetical protein [Chloroflexota bacterium]
MRENSLIQFLARNLGWMLVSLFLAIAIWAAANLESNPVEEREIKNLPVSVSLPEGFVLTRQPEPATVSAVVRTQQNEWNLLVPDDILISADLGGIREPGEYRIELQSDVVSQRHARVVAIRPSTLVFAVDQEAEKRVAVRVIVRREPPLGYSLPSDLSTVCDQTEVTVRGSAERVNSVDHVEVRMDLSDQRNPLTRSFDLIAVQGDGRTATQVEMLPASVSCTIDIQAREDVIQMRVLPEVVGDPPDGYLFEGYVAQPETVGVTGSRSAISAMGGLVRTVPIDISDEIETFTNEVQLDLPEGVTLVPENQLIRVTVTISPVRSSRQFQEVPVEITGLDPTAHRATVLPNAVTVLVVGPEAMLPMREDVRVLVDLADMAAGNYQLAPQGLIIDQETGNGMQITVRPEQVSVTIESLFPTPSPSPTPTVEPPIPTLTNTATPEATLPVGRAVTPTAGSE